jgi:hypothetical protein
MTTAIYGDKVAARTSAHLRQVQYRAAMNHAAIFGRRWYRSMWFDEQCEPFSHPPERVNMRYNSLAGWVLAMVLPLVA